MLNKLLNALKGLFSQERENTFVLPTKGSFHNTKSPEAKLEVTGTITAIPGPISGWDLHDIAFIEDDLNPIQPIEEPLVVKSLINELP